MSKAFTREDDGGDGDDDDLPEIADSLPRGQPNYMTPDGRDRLAAELRTLNEIERPKLVEIVSWAAGNGDRSENGDYIYGKKRLREIDRRRRFLVKRLEQAEVVDPARQQHLRQVFFGATVTYVDSRDRERTVHIVGVDETGFGPDRVSWISPVARALHKAREGDVVTLRTPSGPEELEVLEIRYGAGAATT